MCVCAERSTENRTNAALEVQKSAISNCHHNVTSVSRPIPCQTLIERVAGFMDTYHENVYG